MRWMLERRGERGSVLLISVLVILVLAGVALVVVQKVTMEISNVGCFRVAKQGYYVGEAGLSGPIAQAAKDQTLFVDYLSNNSSVIRSTDISQDFYEFESWGSFGPEFSSEGAAQFNTYFSDPVDTLRIPGYSVAGFCYRKYTVTADGFLGTADESDPETVRHAAQTRFVSHIYLGPFQCGY